MKVLICGSRDYENRKAILALIISLPPDTIVIEGGARGADSIVRELATQRGLTVEEVPADWKKYGKGAGPIRNTKMLKMKPDLVFAFYSDKTTSKGTKNMTSQARAKGVQVFEFDKDGGVITI